MEQGSLCYTIVVYLLNCVWPFCDSMDCIARQALLSTDFFRQGYWNGLLFPSSLLAIYFKYRYVYMASWVVLVVKNPPANAGDIRDVGSIPGSGRSSGGRHGNGLQYSCLENPMDRGAWKTTVHRVPQSRIRLKQRSMHAHRHMSIPNAQSGLRTILTKVPIPPCL